LPFDEYEEHKEKCRLVRFLKETDVPLTLEEMSKKSGVARGVVSEVVWELVRSGMVKAVALEKKEKGLWKIGYVLVG